MKAVIMAGGRGSRISTLFPDIPKPLIPIKSREGIVKPVLEWEICSLRDQGVKDIILTVSYSYEKIIEYFNDGLDIGVHIDYYIENSPLGNAGALFKLSLDDDFLLLNADALFDVDFSRMISFHKSHQALVTLFTHPNSHPYDSGLIIADEKGYVKEWLSKEDNRPQYYKNRVNAGLHVVSPKALSLALETSGLDVERIGELGDDGKRIKVDLDRQVLKPLCKTRNVICYDSPEYVKDMGTPERFKQVSEDFALGIVNRKNLSNTQRAIFLDRDGTINKYVGFLRNTEELELLPGVIEAIKKINQSGYLCIIVTNQPVIARGEVTVENLNNIHNKMETLLGAGGAFIDALYYCPHHPHKGYKGEISSLKIECECRKPKPGMLLKAATDFNIDLSQSWMIGDSESDIQAGKNAGCKTALIGISNYKQDISADSLLEAVEIITDSN